MELVSVYGTLKKGGKNHWALQKDDAVFAMDTVTLDKYSMYDGVFPTVLRPQSIYHSSVQICCEVYAVHTFRTLDVLEGHPKHFKRELVKMIGIPEPVWMYIYQGTHVSMTGELIHSGWWDPTTEFEYTKKKD